MLIGEVSKAARDQRLECCADTNPPDKAEIGEPRGAIQSRSRAVHTRTRRVVGIPSGPAGR